MAYLLFQVRLLLDLFMIVLFMVALISTGDAEDVNKGIKVIVT